MFYIHVNYALRRFYSSQELVQRAEEFRNSERKRPQYIHDELRELSPETFITHWKDYLDKDDPNLIKDLYNGKKPWHFRNDETALRVSFDRLAENKLKRLSSGSITSHITGGAPLLDMLISDYKQNNGGFVIPPLSYLEKIQSNRCVSAATITTGHKFFEVTIHESPENEIDAAIEFFNECYELEGPLTTHKVVSFDVESLHIPVDQYNLLPSSQQTDLDRVVIASAAVKGQKSKMIPARILIGGVTWTLLVRFQIDSNFKEDGTIEHILHNGFIQPKLAEFLKGLPTLVGFGVKHDVVDVQDYVRRLGCPEFEFKEGWVDIATLGVVAGFHSRRATMFNFNLQVLGGILSKNNSRADDKWALPLNELPDSLKIYAAGDTRSAFNCYIVLYAAIIRNFFPDPEVVCLITNRDQYEFSLWFSGLLIGTLKGLEIDHDSYTAARTRVDLLMCLRVREPSLDLDVQTLDGMQCLPYNKPGKLRADPPERIKLLAKAIPPWPTVTFGGARYLHSTRFFALEQKKVFSSELFPVLDGSNIWKDIQVDQFKMNQVTYCQELKVAHPTSGSSVRCLAPDPDLKFPVATLNPYKVLNSDISNIARKQGRDSRYVILEWVRLNKPEYITILLDRASETYPNRESRLWFSQISRYEDLRASYYFTTGSHVEVKCVWAEKKIDGAIARLEKSVEEDVSCFEGLAALARKRKADLEDAAAAGVYRKRVKIQDQLPAPPTRQNLTDEQKEKRKVRNRKARLRQQKVKKARKAEQATVDGQCVPDPGVSGSSCVLIRSIGPTPPNLVYSKVVTDFQKENPQFQPGMMKF